MDVKTTNGLLGYLFDHNKDGRAELDEIAPTLKKLLEKGGLPPVTPE
jgi:hypothetical protein